MLGEKGDRKGPVCGGDDREESIVISEAKIQDSTSIVFRDIGANAKK